MGLNFKKRFYPVVLSLCFSSTVFANSLILIGKIPAEYLKQQNSQEFQIGYIKIEDRLITEIAPLDSVEEMEDLKSLAENYIELTNPETGDYDAIYPGLIDLHGHNKQNMLPTWTSALGRFANRYEWRQDSSEYQTVQSNNMNPWSAATASKVAAFRWAELQAMILGTTYLQGTIQNHKDFAIHSVEDRGAFISQRTSIQSSGDIIDPFKWSFLWNQLKPIMEEAGCTGTFSCYKSSLSTFFKKNCYTIESADTPAIEALVPEFVIQDPGSDLSMDWLLSAEEILPQACPGVQNSHEMILFLTKKFGNLPHKEIVNRNAYLDDPKKGAIITHLAEGRRLDPETWAEFQLLKLAGLAREGMNFIHGNGLKPQDFKHMAQHNMGLVWSPYSNFLLYGETVDIKEALKAGVTIALGSDWTPTGSKSVLEELRVATDYLSFQGISVEDKTLYDMVTKNSAIIMNHYGFEKKGEHGVGTLEVGAMGTVIATAINHNNPYTNLIHHVRAQEINLVVIDGQPIYGNRSYIAMTGSDYEVISGKIFDKNLTTDPQDFPKSLEPDLKNDVITNDEMGIIIAQYGAKIELANSTQCDFTEEKVFVYQQSNQWEERVQPILEESGLNLDTYAGITRYIGVALLSQGRNVQHDGRQAQIKEGAVRTMPHLYGCEDQEYMDYLLNMANPERTNQITVMQNNRENYRIEGGFFTEFLVDDTNPSYSVPHELAVLYGFEEPIEAPLSRKIVEVTIDD